MHLSKLFIPLLKENPSRVSFEQIKELIYHYAVEGESHTVGNLLQSHIMRRKSEDSLVNLCGYKKPHPLEDKILFIVSLKRCAK